jgi:pimeloyl-ACP methyl ester carboxylesterase
LPIATDLRERLERGSADRELLRLAPHLNIDIRFDLASEGFVEFAVRNGTIDFQSRGASPHITIASSVQGWVEVLRQPPLPRFHAFTALHIANDGFVIRGDDLLIAQARPTLERLFELITASPATKGSAIRRDLSQITGGYHSIEAEGRRYEIYAEAAGQGSPVVFLHTAGADGRQYLDQLADIELASGFKLISPDLPFHGRSLPPLDWDGGPYRLTAALYEAWCAATLEQVGGAPAIIVGGSMGAAMALHLAAERPELLLGVVAVEPPFRASGRINPYQNHVAVNAALHNGSYVRGLMSPESPVARRRRAAWIYSQGAPGVYPGDLAFYVHEFDGAVTAPKIDARRTPVALLCGTYDYSATPEDGKRLADLIPGAHLEVMPGLGHFPMCENPDLFRPYLATALQHVASHGTR